MAAARRRQPARVADLLAQAPQDFEFFQAIRLLDQLATRSANEPGGPADPLLGQDTPPAREAVRFRTHAAASFPAAAIDALAAPTGRPPEMVVNFLGLTGPNGVLPQHMTALLIRRNRANDIRLSAFQDLFNHRLTSLFYRAWEKYCFPVRYERARRLDRPPASDVVTRLLLALGGYGADALLNRHRFDDDGLTFYAGHLAQRPRNATSLAALLSDYFNVPVAVAQFAGQWLTLDPADQSRLPTRSQPRGQHAALGAGLTVGERVLLVDARFRVLVGPLTLAQYERFLPDGDDYPPLFDWTRTYAGPQFDFTVQLTLLAAEVPATKLGAGGARLGWTSFLTSQPAARDANGASLPCRD